MIRIDSVTKKYPSGIVSLSNVSLEVERGSVMGLVGTNGAGKSTLLRILAGILREDSGSVTVSGIKIFENSLVKERIAFVSDEGYLVPSFTLDSMASFHSSFRRNFSHEKFSRLCKMMGLDPTRRISTYSKGMKRQGEVILALSSGCDYILFDETFDGLDPIARESARRMIAETVATDGTTVILSSHNLFEMENICDSIALIDSGKLIFKKSLSDTTDGHKKYQAVFEEEADPLLIPDSFHHARMSGKLLTFISDIGEETVEKLLSSTFNGARVIYCEAVPLTLEEIFSLEVELFRGKEDESRA